MKIILASQSPRRAALLDLVQIDYEIFENNFDESSVHTYDLEEKSKELAYGKALDVFNNTQGDRAIIGGDTFVEKDGKIYGKPKDRSDAIKMLKELQGDTYTAYTSLAILIEERGKYKEFKELQKVEVTISKMSDEEIIEYVDREEPFDKAGAHAIQSCFAKFIEKIDGDYMSVIGLPVNRVYKILKENEVL